MSESTEATEGKKTGGGRGKGGARRWFLVGLQYGLPSLVLLIALALRIWDPLLVSDLRLKVFDYYQEILPRAYETLPVKIVDLDDQSLERHGQWPWPRILLARMVQRLAEAGAATVAFDIVFSEPDRTSPNEIIKLWPDTLVDRSLREKALSLESHDALFASSIEAAGNVVLGFALTPRPGGVRPPARFGYGFTGDDPRAFVARFRGSVTNLPILSAVGRGEGSLNLVPERDGIVRRVPLLVNHIDKIYPGLSLEALRVVQGASTVLVKSSGASGEEAFGQSTGVVGVKVGRLAAPTDSSGRIWLYQTREQEQRFIPAWKILDGSFAPTDVEGAIVYVGSSAAGLADLKITPLHPALPGVAVHAQITEQLLLGSYLTRPDWAFGAELFYLLVTGILMVLLVPRVGALWSAIIGAVLVAAGVGGSWYAFSAETVRLLFDPIYPVVLAGMVFLTSSLISYFRAERARQELRGMFGMYVSPKLVDQLVARPEAITLGGEMRPLTVMFIDVRGFTTLSENMTADELTAFMNRFLTEMTAAVLGNDGTVGHYTGDGLMAFWNAPVDQPDHAVRACRAALEMGDRLARLNAALEAEAEAAGTEHRPIRIGIGLNSGVCCVGNIGSDQRFDYSILGDSVNVAARLEAETKTYGAPVIIGEATREGAAEFAAVEIGLVRVRGRDAALRVFALVGDETMAQTPEFASYAADHAALMEAAEAPAPDHERIAALAQACAAAYRHMAGLYRKYLAEEEALTP